MTSFIRCQNYLINTSSIRRLFKTMSTRIDFVIGPDGNCANEESQILYFEYGAEGIRDREFERFVSELIRSSDNTVKNVVGTSSLATSSAPPTSSVAASSFPPQ